MVTTNKPTANGTAEKKPTVIIDTTTKPHVEGKPQANGAPVKEEQPKPVTLNSQREKTEKLNLLFEREEKLSTTKKELERFKIATDESTNTLRLEDGKGARFSTSNPTLIKSVMDVVLRELEAKQQQVSTDIIAIG